MSYQRKGWNIFETRGLGKVPQMTATCVSKWGYHLNQSLESFSIIFDKLDPGVNSNDIQVTCTHNGLLITLKEMILIKV